MPCFGEVLIRQVHSAVCLFSKFKNKNISSGHLFVKLKKNKNKNPRIGETWAVVEQGGFDSFFMFLDVCFEKHLSIV